MHCLAVCQRYYTQHAPAKFWNDSPKSDASVHLDLRR
jgi:hypothetical protein